MSSEKTNSEKINQAFSKLGTLLPFQFETISPYDTIIDGTDKIVRNLELIRTTIKSKRGSDNTNTFDGIQP